MVTSEWTPLISTKKAVRSLVERSLLTNRQRALREEGVGHAAHLIKDAVLGYQDAPYEGYFDPYQDEQSIISTISVICGRLVVQLRGAVVFCCWVLFMLTFVEPPHWCRDASHLQIVIDEGNTDNTMYKEYGDCKLLLTAYGTTAGNEMNKQLYPNADNMLLTVNQTNAIEFICTCFITLYLGFAFGDDGFSPRLFFYPGKKRRLHTIQCAVLVCLFISLVYDHTANNPFLRMLILCTFLRRFQLELWTFLSMIPDLMAPLSMLAIVVVFYAWFGVVIFYDTEQGSEAFPNLPEAIWTLWICVTTANYPDVMMPSYNQHRGVALYSISFMSLCFFYIMNLVLAVAVNNYDLSIDERKRSRTELSKKLLSQAFELLDHDGKHSVSRSSIMHVITILNQDIKEIRGMTREEQSILFAFLDKDGSNTINREEFLDFGSVLLVQLAKKSDYATFVETNLPSVFRSQSYQTLCKLVKSKRFDHVIEVLLVLNALVVAAQDYPMLAGEDVSLDPHYKDGYMDTIWENLETIFTVFYVIEATLKIMVNGWKAYIEKPRNTFDFSITVLVCLATAYVYYPNAYNNHSLIEFVVMARVLRLCRLLFAIDSFRVFGAITLEIIPAASSIFMVLLFIGSGFSILGMIFFGGYITRDASNPISHLLLESTDWVEGSYWANSFNDMSSGMNVLFNLLVVNNWTTQASGLEDATGRKWGTRLYFFSFYVLGVLGISNVITSFVINAFFQQMQTIEHRQGPEEEIGDEVFIQGSRAVFDPSEITGTRTGLRSSAYFARIVPTHSDVEVDEREALRRLFSRTSTDSISDNDKA